MWQVIGELRLWIAGQQRVGKTVQTAAFCCGVHFAEHPDPVVRGEKACRTMAGTAIEQAIAGDFEILFGHIPCSVERPAQGHQHAF